MKEYTINGLFVRVNNLKSLLDSFHKGKTALKKRDTEEKLNSIYNYLEKMRQESPSIK